MPSTETTEKPAPAPRPHRKTFTKALCDLVTEGDAEAAAEVKARLVHGGTLKPHNLKQLKAVEALADSILPEPEPEPAPAPRVKGQRSAATEFTNRVRLLSTENVRLRCMRATKLAKAEGFTLEDVASLSDEDCVELVSEAMG